MMIARLRGQPTPIRQLRADTPPAVEKALTKALQTNPDDRYTTAVEFADALTASGESSGGLFSKLKEKFK
jgi:serine/threonine-protein kinase